MFISKIIYLHSILIILPINTIGSIYNDFINLSLKFYMIIIAIINVRQYIIITLYHIYSRIVSIIKSIRRLQELLLCITIPSWI